MESGRVSARQAIRRTHLASDGRAEAAIEAAGPRLGDDALQGGEGADAAISCRLLSLLDDLGRDAHETGGLRYQRCRRSRRRTTSPRLAEIMCRTAAASDRSSAGTNRGSRILACSYAAKKSAAAASQLMPAGFDRRTTRRRAHDDAAEPAIDALEAPRLAEALGRLQPRLDRLRA